MSRALRFVAWVLASLGVGLGVAEVAVRALDLVPEARARSRLATRVSPAPATTTSFSTQIHPYGGGSFRPGAGPVDDASIAAQRGAEALPA